MDRKYRGRILLLLLGAEAAEPHKRKQTWDRQERPMQTLDLGMSTSLIMWRAMKRGISLQQCFNQCVKCVCVIYLTSLSKHFSLKGGAKGMMGKGAKTEPGIPTNKNMLLCIV